MRTTYKADSVMNYGEYATKDCKSNRLLDKAVTELNATRRELVTLRFLRGLASTPAACAELALNSMLQESADSRFHFGGYSAEDEVFELMHIPCSWE